MESDGTQSPMRGSWWVEVLIPRTWGTGLHKQVAALKSSKHYKRVDVPLRGVLKRTGQTSDDFETETLPDPYRAVIGAHHEVELHRAKAACAGRLERMRAHGASESPARSTLRGHISAVGDMCSTALLIGAHEVSTDNVATLVGDEYVVTEPATTSYHFRLRSP